MEKDIENEQEEEKIEKEMQRENEEEVGEGEKEKEKEEEEKKEEEKGVVGIPLTSVPLFSTTLPSLNYSLNSSFSSFSRSPSPLLSSSGLGKEDRGEEEEVSYGDGGGVAVDEWRKKSFSSDVLAARRTIRLL